MEITLKKINDEVVVPLKVSGGSDTRPVRGNKLFGEVYANIFLCARKKSGKTVVIQKIIKECTGKSTIVLAFCSTVNKDANWLALKKWCTKHKIPFEGFSSIKEHKVDFLDAFIRRLEDEAEEEQLGPESDEEEDRGQMKSHGKGAAKPLNFFGGKKPKQDYDSAESDESSADEADDMFDGGSRADAETLMAQNRLFDKRNKTSIVKKDPYQAAQYILIFDDLSHELKLPSLVSLLKKNRHYKLKVILSSQYLNDLKPESIRQMDYVLLFKGQSDDKLAKVIKDCDIAIDLPTLKTIYDDATKEDFGFLYIDVRNDQFRKCFNKLYMLSKPADAEEDGNN